LTDWQTSEDPQALSHILADLYSPEKEIRDAAIDAAEQIHNTNAIPVLKSIAMTNDDTDEQMALAATSLDGPRFQTDVPINSSRENPRGSDSDP